jgi:hypothetical protein
VPYQECTNPSGHEQVNGVCIHCGLGASTATDANDRSRKDEDE